MKRMGILLLLVPLIFFLSGCGGKWITYYDKALTGQVVDDVSGNAIEDALVVGVWQHIDWFGEGPGGYANIEVVQSNEKGDFWIPWWFKFRPWRVLYTVGHSDPVVVIYKAGYKLHKSNSASRAGLHEMTLTEEQKRLARKANGINPARLERITSDEEKIKNIRDFELMIGLGDWPIISFQRPKLEKAVYEEIDALSINEADTKTLKDSLTYSTLKRR